MVDEKKTEEKKDEGKNGRGGYQGGQSRGQGRGGYQGGGQGRGRGRRKYEPKEGEETRDERDTRERLDKWVPKTQLGKDVLSGKVKSYEDIFNSGVKILEGEIIDKLLVVKSDLIDIGQSKGKFGGGKRRAFKQTQKKKMEGNVVTFTVMAVVGDGKGFLGVGVGHAKETLPAKEKAIRKAKLNIFRVIRGCGSYDCSCDEFHSIPMAVEGKCSGVRVKLIPAPQGTGLVAGDELKKVLKLAGIKDIYTRTFGPTKTTGNTVKACLKALRKLEEVRL